VEYWKWIDISRVNAYRTLHDLLDFVEIQNTEIFLSFMVERGKVDEKDIRTIMSNFIVMEASDDRAFQLVQMLHGKMKERIVRGETFEWTDCISDVVTKHRRALFYFFFEYERYPMTCGDVFSCMGWEDFIPFAMDWLEKRMAEPQDQRPTPEFLKWPLIGALRWNRLEQAKRILDWGALFDYPVWIAAMNVPAFEVIAQYYPNLGMDDRKQYFRFAVIENHFALVLHLLKFGWFDPLEEELMLAVKYGIRYGRRDMLVFVKERYGVGLKDLLKSDSVTVQYEPISNGPPGTDDAGVKRLLEEEGIQINKKILP
jgi:hypothetical protein